MPIVETDMRSLAYATPLHDVRGGRSPQRATQRCEDARASRPAFDDPLLALLEIVPEGIVVLSVDGVVLSCNESFAALIGLPLVVVLDESLDDRFSARDAVAFRALVVGCGSLTRIGDLTLRRVDGTAVPVRVSVVTLCADVRGITHVGAAFTDLRTDRDAAEKQSATSEQLAYEIQRRRAIEQRLERTLRWTHAATWEIDLDSGKLEHAQGMDRVLGSAAMPIGSVADLIDTFVPEDRPALACAFDDAKETGMVACDARRSTAVGNTRWIRLAGQRLPDSSNRLAGFASDVTTEREGAL